jgi:lysozyme
MKLSEDGLEAIVDFEGSVLKAYRDVGGIWTIGVGHTGPDVHPDSLWTPDKVHEALAADLTRFELAVATSVTVPLTQGQFDALVSLAFNIGEHAFKTSTLVKRLNAGNYKEAACQFVVWNKVGGNVNNGLLARRAHEMYTFVRAS